MANINANRAIPILDSFNCDKPPIGKVEFYGEPPKDANWCLALGYRLHRDSYDIMAFSIASDDNYFKFLKQNNEDTQIPNFTQAGILSGDTIKTLDGVYTIKINVSVRGINIPVTVDHDNGNWSVTHKGNELKIVSVHKKIYGE